MTPGRVWTPDGAGEVGGAGPAMGPLGAGPGPLRRHAGSLSSDPEMEQTTRCEEGELTRVRGGLSALPGHRQACVHVPGSVCVELESTVSTRDESL